MFNFIEFSDDFCSEFWKSLILNKLNELGIKLNQKNLKITGKIYINKTNFAEKISSQ